MEYFFFFNDTATTEIYTRSIVGSVRCVQETGIISSIPIGIISYPSLFRLYLLPHLYFLFRRSSSRFMPDLFFLFVFFNVFYLFFLRLASFFLLLCMFFLLL
eukprot:TRINITY_DN71451_c0_g1_i1.p2 TRINITY_DN71451_c0_g1~~TRINITY_DN71451_c0_g1_i1.p2  ORF type:complete len:102 (-),score=23.09 TRINITY_DN71451_c0_g1_i1:56-361(-)